MNGIDIALLLLLLAAAARGFWRGFFREVFGFLALVFGLWAALQSTATGAALLGRYVGLPAATLAAVAFLCIFMLVHTGANLVGVLLSRVAGPRRLFGLGRLAGAVFAAGKTAVVLACVLLFFDLFPLITPLEAQLRDSRLARPLTSVAAAVLRAGLREPPPPPASGQT
jgi:membrane protein required for colicin V production